MTAAEFPGRTPPEAFSGRPGRSWRTTVGYLGGVLLAVALAAAFVASALGASVAVAQDEPAYAGLDKDLSGTTIKMAAIGGGNYEAMYDSIAKFEEETGATVEIVFLGDGFEIDRYLKAL